MTGQRHIITFASDVTVDRNTRRGLMATCLFLHHLDISCQVTVFRRFDQIWQVFPFWWLCRAVVPNFTQQNARGLTYSNGGRSRCDSMQGTKTLSHSPLKHAARHQAAQDDGREASPRPVKPSCQIDVVATAEAAVRPKENASQSILPAHRCKVSTLSNKVFPEASLAGAP